MSRIIKVEFLENRWGKVIHMTKLNFNPAFQRGDRITLSNEGPNSKPSEYIIASIHHFLHDWVAPHDEGTDYSIKIKIFPAEEEYKSRAC